MYKKIKQDLQNSYVHRQELYRVQTSDLNSKGRLWQNSWDT